MKYRRYTNFDKQDAYKEYVGIIQDFSQQPNVYRLSRKLYLWGDKWNLPKNQLYKNQKKIFRGLL